MEKHGVKAIVQGTQVTTKHLSKLAELVDQGVMSVHVDKTFPLDQAGEALVYLQTGKALGKVVVQVREH
jgi:NADPH:quinone reductase-like Zn-dependent oxidoreductase